LGRVAFSFATIGISGQLNDFYAYWAAGALLNRGENPYDVGALASVQQAAGIYVETGSGFSYPLFFAHLMRPLALLPPATAATIFSVLSLIALAFAVAILLGSLPQLRWPLALGGGVVAGLFPPVIGSLYFGQANLFVLLLLAIAYRCVTPGPMLGIASAIKLYPVSGFLAVLTERPPRWRRLAIGLGVLGSLLLLQLGSGGGSLSGRTRYFFGPDTYWSNESINGWLSRLGIDSTWTHAPFRGLQVEATMVTIVLLLTVATVIVLLRAPAYTWEGAVALSLWLGVVSAPKNSLWNFTPLLLAITFMSTRLAGRWWLVALGVVAWLLIELQAQLDGARETIYQASPALAWLSSVGLYGAFILGGLCAYVVLRPGFSGRPAPLAESGLSRAAAASQAGP
jgi:Glycosyltransferase family 87